MWLLNYNIDKIIDRLQQNKIKFYKLTQEEVDSYKQEWFNKYIPIDKREKALNSYCFDKDECCGFLWHAFSYEILDCFVGDEADIKFDLLDKNEATLLLNIDDIAYKITDASGIKAENLGILYDVILTSSDFSWTYVKTHELTCGPYFYSI